MRNILKLVVAIAMAVPAVSFAATGITNSKHNLASTSAAAVKAATETELCIFCHIPHRAQTTLTLWNRNNPTTAAYTWDATATTQGTTLPGALANTGTSKCLSCHDGSLALGDVAHIAAVGNDLNVGGPNTTAGVLQSSSAASIGFGGVMNKNHPVGIPYFGNAASGASFGYNAATAVAANCDINAVCIDSASGDLPLYGTAVANATLECGSCHEPHNFDDSAAPAATRNVKFLRKNNNGSALCLTCHNK